MSETTWRDRLLSLIDADERSDRALSTAAGLGPNYIQQMRDRGTSPNITQTEKLCAVLGVSLIYVLTGMQMDREGEEFLALAATRSPEERRHLLELLRLMPPPSKLEQS
ncbi:hypothetical protein [Aureimonas ureilytica]|nr:hypothetical protein [Aureimonas ureilytica]